MKALVLSTLAVEAVATCQTNASKQISSFIAQIEGFISTSIVLGRQISALKSRSILCTAQTPASGFDELAGADYEVTKAVNGAAAFWSLRRKAISGFNRSSK